MLPIIVLISSLLSYPWSITIEADYPLAVDGDNYELEEFLDVDMKALNLKNEEWRKQTHGVVKQKKKKVKKKKKKKKGHA